MAEHPLFKTVNSTFNVQAPDSFQVECFSADNTHPNIPQLNPHYEFTNDVLRDLLAFLTTPEGDALYITGPTGCGKSSVIEQVAARLHWPVQLQTLHGNTELSDLIGHHTLVNGDMQFVYGPLPLAMKHGHLLVLNEMDLADPAELAGLNDVLGGSGLTIAQNGGEVIKPHPKFRVIATGNSAGSGDSSGQYHGVMQQNLAFLDRFRFMQVAYLTHDSELALLQREVPALPASIAASLIKVATDVRRLFVGGTQDQGELSVTLSTRTLLRWARLIVRFQGAPRLIEYCLVRALTARTDTIERQAIHRIAQDVFGESWSPQDS